jgi:hypothetical protein
MERRGKNFGRIAAVVGGGVVAILVVIEANGSTAGLVAGAAIVLVAGVIANRWWAALLPPIAFLVWLIITLAGNPPDNQEFGWEFAAYIFGFFAAVASLLVLLGVGLRRLLAKASSPPRTTP